MNFFFNGIVFCTPLVASINLMIHGEVGNVHNSLSISLLIQHIWVKRKMVKRIRKRAFHNLWKHPINMMENCVNCHNFCNEKNWVSRLTNSPSTWMQIKHFHMIIIFTVSLYRLEHFNPSTRHSTLILKPLRGSKEKIMDLFAGVTELN